jgi:hypothetical protein
MSIALRTDVITHGPVPVFAHGKRATVPQPTRPSRDVQGNRIASATPSIHMLS